VAPGKFRRMGNVVRHERHDGDGHYGSRGHGEKALPVAENLWARRQNANEENKVRYLIRESKRSAESFQFPPLPLLRTIIICEQSISPEALRRRLMSLRRRCYGMPGMVVGDRPFCPPHAAEGFSLMQDHQQPI
jgi:hypothetical protein